MSVTFQRFFCAGNICRDPELLVSSGKEPKNYTRFTVALNETWAGTDRVVYIHCEAWGKMAEAICKFKRKGDPVIVCGRFRQYEYTKEGDTHPRTSMILVVNEINYLPRADRMVEPEVPRSDRPGSEDYTHKEKTLPPEEASGEPAKTQKLQDGPPSDF